MGIDAIDNITFSDDFSENERYRLAWKNYMRMHYYVDDPYNKLRIIVIQNGAKFRLISSYFNTGGVSLPFVCQAMNTAPNDYHIVILSHEFDVPLTYF